MAETKASVFTHSVRPTASRLGAPAHLLRRAIVLSLDAILAFVLLYVCLIIIDLPLMDTYPDHVFKARRYPNLDNVYRDEDYSRYHINSYGLVGHEPAPPSDTGIYRVAVFGDSFVEALQVPDERKLTTLLEVAITPPPGKQRAEVWNFGHSADNTGNAYARWLSAAGQVKFDFVVFAFNEADALENRLQDVRNRSGSFLFVDSKASFRVGQSHGADDGPRFPALNESLPRFHTFHYLLRTRAADYVDGARRKLRALMRGRDITTLDPADVESSSASHQQIDDTVRQLRFVHRQIAATGVPVILLALPTDAATPAGFGSHRAGANFAYRTITDRLRQAAVPLVDPYPSLASDIASGGDPYSDWEAFHHFNARGHRLVAQALSQYLGQHPELGLQVRNIERTPARR